MLSSSISDKIIHKQLFKCSDHTSYKNEITIEKCVDCWTALGYLYFWDIYPKGVEDENISLTIQTIR